MKRYLLMVSIVLLFPSLHASSVATQSLSKTDELFKEMGKEYPSLTVIEELLKDTSLVESMKNGFLPLHYATKRGHLDVCKVLLTCGANVNACIMEKGITPLLIACAQGNEELCLLFLEQNRINVNCKDDKDTTPLHFAAKAGMKKVCEELISTHGVNVLARTSSKKTVLHIAVQAKNSELTRYFLAQRVPVNVANNAGITPLHLAARGGCLPLVELLLENSAPVNAQAKNGWTPLFYAAQFGSTEIGTALLRKKAQVTVVDGKTAFDVAFDYANESFCMMLLQSSIAMHFPAATEHKTGTLHRVVTSGSLELIESMLGRIDEVNVTDSQGETLLFQAIRRGNQEVVSLLLGKGADVHALRDDGRTALHEAALQNSSELCNVLLTGGAGIDVQDTFGKTPLSCAVKSGSINSAQFLIEQGASLHLKDKLGCTPLHEAVSAGNATLVELLLTRGAPRDCTDEYDETPLDMAIKRKNAEIVLLLTNNGAFEESQQDALRSLREADTPLLNKTTQRRTSQDEVRVKLQFGEQDSPCTRLYRAVLFNKGVEKCKELIKEGALLDTRDILGKTALHLAVEKDYIEVVIALLKAGASPFIHDHKKRTPLLLAAQQRKTVRLVQMLDVLRASRGTNDLYLKNALQEIVSDDRVDDEVKKTVHAFLENLFSPLGPSTKWTAKGIVDTVCYVGMIGFVAVVIFGNKK